MKLLSANAIQQLYAFDRVIEKTRTYAPEMIARGESIVRAYHFRYTARRLFTLGESETALNMLHFALRANWRILREEPQKNVDYNPRGLYYAPLTVQICSTSIILIREWKICWKNRHGWNRLLIH
jgi:hypothetical protein